MLGLWRKPTVASLHQHKTIIINGSRFVIRQVVPLADFPLDKMPQIFSEFSRSNWQIDPTNEKSIRRLIEDMKAVVKAGLVSPNENDGITVEDVFRDQEIGHKLYLAIIEHSLLRFRGLKKCFFLAVKTLLRPIIWLKLMGKGPVMSYGVRS